MLAALPPLPIEVVHMDYNDPNGNTALYSMQQMYDYAIAAMMNQQREDAMELREMQDRLEDPFND